MNSAVDRIVSNPRQLREDSRWAYAATWRAHTRSQFARDSQAFARVAPRDCCLRHPDMALTRSAKAPVGGIARFVRERNDLDWLAGRVLLTVATKGTSVAVPNADLVNQSNLDAPAGPEISRTTSDLSPKDGRSDQGRRREARSRESIRRHLADGALRSLTLDRVGRARGVTGARTSRPRSQDQQARRQS